MDQSELSVLFVDYAQSGRHKIGERGYIERAGGLAISLTGGQVFRNESRVQVRAGQVFSALENVSRTIVTDPKSSVEASCDIGRERRERVRGEKSAPSSNYQRAWENERVTCCCYLRQLCGSGEPGAANRM